MTSTADYRYELPESVIAQTPVEPRHASRLLDTRSMSDHTFLDLPGLLAEGDLVVVNRTKVRHARLSGHKAESGGAVEMLILDHLADGRWEGLVKPARRIRPGTVLEFGHITATVVDGPTDGRVLVTIDGAPDIEAALESIGHVPLPPYITTTLDDPGRYQTMFADEPGSAAAPTAGLHFTPAVVDGLRAAGVELATVELRVGIATFRPMMADSVEEHLMHREWYSLSPETAAAIAATRRRGGRVVAIGTTTVRVLETCAVGEGLVEPGEGHTELFLHPANPPTVTDILVTNFHMPASSLLVLVASFVGDRWRQIYAEALQRGYRFLSFGDAMVCERETR